jgi:hypothetical protein
MDDAIVIGARCAGAPVAMLLARKGYKVLRYWIGADFPARLLTTTGHWRPSMGRTRSS